MKKIAAIAGVCAVTAGLALSGCSTKTETKTETTESGAATATSAPTVKKTIADYVAENKIIETAIKQGDPGPPTFQFPIPPDWRPAGKQRPDWAYGAIVYDKAKDPADPPFMTAVISRLKGGGVSEDKIFEYAPGLLQNLPGYSQDGEVRKTTFGEFDAIVFQGSYLREGEKRYIAQLTTVIPEKDGSLVVLQLNADAPEGQENVVKEAATVIEADTKITN